MERRHRRLVIASLSIGAAVAFTVPTLVSAGPADGAGEETSTSVPDRSSGTESPDAETPSTTSTTSATGGTETGPTPAPTTSAPPPAEDPQLDPAPPVVVEPAPTTSAPAPVAVEAAPPAPVVEETPVVEGPSTSTGTLTVEVATASGATRQVSLRTATGDLIAGPVTVDGQPITFSDLAPGDHDLFVEHFADGGGTFLTRTPITITAGSDLRATCDAETLDCTVG